MDDIFTRPGPAAWLALLRAPALNSILRSRLLADFTTPQDIFRAPVRILQERGLHPTLIKYLCHPAMAAVESDLRWLEKPGNRLLTLDDPPYPVLLRLIPDPPPVLFVRGEVEVLNTIQISIVGSRRPSPDGRRVARNFARQLSVLGITVTSGLALGLDGQAHRGALEGSGHTLAVLGSGLDVVYPAAHADLAAQVAERGALVSEFPPDTPPLPRNFPRRNRIISGLSAGVLVVEAALVSGSLITARHALEQGREVFAVPGSISNPLARGCHALIRQGAKLVENVADILEEIGPLASLVQNAPPEPAVDTAVPTGLDEHGKLLLDNIGVAPVSIDELVNQTGLPVDAVCACLTDLELSGLVVSVPGGDYQRIYVK